MYNYYVQKGHHSFSVFNNNRTQLIVISCKLTELHEAIINTRKLYANLLLFFYRKDIYTLYTPSGSSTGNIEIWIACGNYISKEEYEKIKEYFNNQTLSFEVLDNTTAAGSEVNGKHKTFIDISDCDVATIKTKSSYCKYQKITFNTDYTDNIRNLLNMKMSAINKIAPIYTDNAKTLSQLHNYTDVELLNIGDLLDAFNKVEEDSDLTFGHRYPHINNVINGSLCGDLIGVVAAAGVGKTTICMDLANEYVKAIGKKGIMFSLEMAAHSCFLRCATITAKPDIDGKVITKRIKNEIKDNKDFVLEVVNDWSNLLYIDRGSLSLEEMDYCITKAQKLTDNEIKCVVIDYAQYIDEASNISKAGLIARGTKELLKKHKIYGLLAIQTGKRCSSAFTPITDEHIEGVSAIKQSCDYVLSLYRCEKEPTKLHCTFLKSRWSDGNEKFELVKKGLKHYSKDAEEREEENATKKKNN